MAPLLVLAIGGYGHGFNSVVREELRQQYYVGTPHWIMSNSNCSIPLGGDYSYINPGEVPFVTPKCRAEPYWCPLSRAAAPGATDEAPPQLAGSVPCSLLEACNNLAHLAFYRASRPPNRLTRCLGSKRVVILGDSSVGELMVEMMLLFSRRSKNFTQEMINLEWKFQSGLAHTVVEADGLRADMWPNQRNWTFYDNLTQVTVQFLHSGGPNMTDHVGISTLTDPAFEADLRRLGVHRDSRASERPDVAVFSTTFHDDLRFSGGMDCSLGNNCSCDQSSYPTEKSWSWAHAYDGYVNASRRAAELIATVASSGVRTVYLTLFPRDKERHGKADVLRAVLEATMHAELQRSGYFKKRGRFVDVRHRYSNSSSSHALLLDVQELPLRVTSTLRTRTRARLPRATAIDCTHSAIPHHIPHPLPMPDTQFRTQFRCPHTSL